MNLIQTVTNKAETAARLIAEIAKREAFGKTKGGDAEKLADALRSIDAADEAKYTAAVECYRRAAELEEVLSTMQAAEGAAAQAREDADQYGAETTAIMEARNAKAMQLAEAQAAAAAKLRALQHAAGDLDELIDAHPDLFPGEGAPYDGFTLQCGENLIRYASAAAPIRHVSATVFARESQRRLQMMDEARAAAQSEFSRARAIWLGKHRRTVFGKRFNPAEPPSFEIPAWDEVSDGARVAAIRM